VLSLIVCWCVAVAWIIARGVRVQKPSPGRARVQAAIAWSFFGALLGAVVGTVGSGLPAAVAIAGAVVGWWISPARRSAAR
jgi:hypothetical protein